MKMRILISTLAVLFLSPIVNAQEYELKWSDEFSQDGKLDTTFWNYEQGYARNEELQWYQPENAYCKGGFLIIEAHREQRTNPLYKDGARDWRRSRKFIECTSSSVTTSGKMEF